MKNDGDQIMVSFVAGALMMAAIIIFGSFVTAPPKPEPNPLHRYRIFMIQCAGAGVVEADPERYKQCDKMYDELVRA